MEGEPSIVEYFAEHEGYRCGYCKSQDTNFSHGMWAHQMNVQDYQDLIDRGWRRSGKYCYKPTMNRTCCPMYTIKCDATEFKLSKSQKKAIKRVNRFLITGKHDTDNDNTADQDEGGDGMGGEGDVTNMETRMADKMKPSSVNCLVKESSGKQPPKQEIKSTPDSQANEEQVASSSTNQHTSNKKQPPKSGSGPDPSRPACRKAKELRAEKRQQKMAANPDKGKKPLLTQKNTSKSLEELLSEPDHASKPAHKLELRLVRSCPRSPEFESSFTATHSVYHAYQMAIHKDPPSKPNQSQFTRFLCDSSLGELHQDGGPSMGYGSFHQQYLLDGKIIAVGVIDILPSCVSSVYLYYDPAYSFLTLGVYSALREVAFVRELSRQTPSLRYYYMGFYIHSCPKMRYKGLYTPSYLVCPETYNWISIEKCRPKLEKSKYSRMAEEGLQDKDQVEDINQILVLYKRTAMPYAVYTAMKKGKNSDQVEVKEYANLAGRTCAERMLLFRK